MGKLSIANLKKTIYYLQRNGLRNTWNAAWERLGDTQKYRYVPITEEQKEELRKLALERIEKAESCGEIVPYFSILVPAYQTDPKFLWELVQSMHEQAYPKWELLILDASEDGIVRKTLREICLAMDLVLYNGREGLDLPAMSMDGSAMSMDMPVMPMDIPAMTSMGLPCEEGHMMAGAVRYVSLSGNGGISENTNAGIPYIRGNYVGLLDHDDVLAPNALYEMAQAIWQYGELAEEGVAPSLLYSDEDKWDGEGNFYEPNHKEDFNFDLLLSNNYICHFTVMARELFSELGLRKEYDGSQDYDLVLRAVAKLMERELSPEAEICHIPKVLYHWRCHSASTAENPRSKSYAYEAGKHALQDFADRQGWKVKVKELKHVGFYRLDFGGETRGEGDETENLACDPQETLMQRADLGAVGGKLVFGGVLTGGRMTLDGSVYYEGLKEGYSGYLHRAVLMQDAEAVDIRCIAVQEEFWPLFEQIVGVPYMMREDAGTAGFDAGMLPADADVKDLSIRFCKALTDQGKRILWDPEWHENL